VIALAIGAALFCLPAKAEQEGTIVVIGTIVETETDEDGNALAVDLEADDGTYSIELSGLGEELLWYVGETVEIDGYVTEDDDGRRYLEVLSFSVVSESM
jgi:hypothetical protein